MFQAIFNRIKNENVRRRRDEPMMERTQKKNVRFKSGQTRLCGNINLQYISVWASPGRASQKIFEDDTGTIFPTP